MKTTIEKKIHIPYQDVIDKRGIKKGDRVFIRKTSEYKVIEDNSINKRLSVSMIGSDGKTLAYGSELIGLMTYRVDAVISFD